MDYDFEGASIPKKVSPSLGYCLPADQWEEKCGHVDRGSDLSDSDPDFIPKVTYCRNDIINDGFGEFDEIEDWYMWSQRDLTSTGYLNYVFECANDDGCLDDDGREVYAKKCGNILQDGTI